MCLCVCSDCDEYKAVGFDCEWNGRHQLTKYGKILLIAICSPRGYCALFRINKLPEVPKVLSVSENKNVFCFPNAISNKILKKFQNFLADPTYVKVGSSLTSLKYLWEDYQIKVNDVLSGLIDKIINDNRQEIVRRLGSRLQNIARHVYHINIHRDVSKFDMTQFDANELSTECIAFASADPHSFIEVYKHLRPSGNANI